MVKVKIRNAGSVMLLVIIFLAYFYMKSSGINYSITDENIYFYMGKLVSEGYLPYKDFFFAHPPLKPFIFASIFLVSGLSFTALKAVPILASALTGYFIYRIMLRMSDVNGAFASLILFLFSYDQLRVSAHPTGINIAIFSIAASLFLLLENRYLLAGILLSVGVLNQLYVIPSAIGLFIMAYLMDGKKNTKLYFTGFIVPLIVVFMLLFLFTGYSMIDSLIIFHFKKSETPDVTSAFDVGKDIASVNLPLFIIGFLGLIIPHKFRKRLLLLYAFNLLFLFLVPKVFYFYFALLFPLLAFTAGILVEHLIDCYRRLRIVFFIILVLILYSGVEGYLRHEARYFESAELIADYIRENSDSGETIFGDSVSVPLIAMLSGRDIAANVVDTNAMRYHSGVTSFETTREKIEKTRFKYLIFRGRAGIGSVDDAQEYAKTECRFDKRFNDKYKGTYLLYDCS